MSVEPALSVVIASVAGLNSLQDLLASLAAQEGQTPAEIILVDRVGRVVREFVRREYPQVRLIEASPRESLPELRRRGIESARGALIALSEDHCQPASDWFSGIAAAHRQNPAAAIGGSLENAAAERLIDRVVFLMEYAAFCPPVASGPVKQLAAANVSYKRTAFESGTAIQSGYRETRLHAALRESGRVVWMEPRLRVWHKKRYGLQQALSERFHYGRWYAGEREARAGPGRRMGILILSAGLPALILGRLAANIFRRPQHWPTFWLGLPLLIGLSIAGTIGEMIGVVFGPGRSSLKLV